MSEEEKEFRKLFAEIEKRKQEREKTHAHLQGFIEGLRKRKRSPEDDSFLGILELMTKGFKRCEDGNISLYEWVVKLIQELVKITKRVNALETNIFQLRETLDRMVQDR